jgi:hypothetical protein
MFLRTLATAALGGVFALSLLFITMALTCAGDMSKMLCWPF